jgi:hypothetical protein
MSGIATAVVAGSVITGVMASNAQSDAAESAAGAQTESSQASIAEQRRQFEAVQKLLKPYVDAGSGAMTDMRSLTGLRGATAQKNAITALETGPQMQAMIEQGENAILQNASATGGLRGGNTQATLAQFRPQLLNQLIEQQFSKYGQIAGLGQASAAGQAAAAQQTGANIGNALTQQGQAAAGAALAQGQAQAQMWGNVGNTIGSVATLKAMKVF